MCIFVHESWSCHGARARDALTRSAVGHPAQELAGLRMMRVLIGAYIRAA